MHLVLFPALALLVCFLSTATVGLAANPFFTTLASDKRVDGATESAPVTVLSLTIETTAASTDVLVLSDGRMYPSSGGPVVYLELGQGTGPWLGSRTSIDWSNSKPGAAVQHGFSLASTSPNLPPGKHILTLAAYSSDGKAFSVGSGSGLGVLLIPSTAVWDVEQLEADSQVISPHPPPMTPPPQILPYVSLLTAVAPHLDAGGTIIALTSGSSKLAGVQGDAFWTTYLDGTNHIENNSTTHSDNDQCTCAETTAPMMTQAYYTGLAAGTHYVSLGASAEPWGGRVNPVQYQVTAGTNLVTLANMTLFGRAVLTQAVDTPLDYVCVATSQGWSGCPPVDKEVVLASVTFTVPESHSGPVAMVAKTLVQADSKDKGGTVTYQIAVDGQKVGTAGVQQLAGPYCVSTRTISSSWVGPLSPGQHTASVTVLVTGDFIHLSMTKDLPLMYFG